MLPVIHIFSMQLGSLIPNFPYILNTVTCPWWIGFRLKGMRGKITDSEFWYLTTYNPLSRYFPFGSRHAGKNIKFCSSLGCHFCNQKPVYQGKWPVWTCHPFHSWSHRLENANTTQIQGFSHCMILQSDLPISPGIHPRIFVRGIKWQNMTYCGCLWVVKVLFKESWSTEISLAINFYSQGSKVPMKVASKWKRQPETLIPIPIIPALSPIDSRGCFFLGASSVISFLTTQVQNSSLVAHAI